MSTHLDQLTQLSSDIDSLRLSLQPFFDMGIDKIQQHANHKQFLQLHTRMMYAMQSLVFIYSGMKGKELPDGFGKVEEYYKRMENIDLKQKPTVSIDKAKVNRLLNANKRR